MQRPFAFALQFDRSSKHLYVVYEGGLLKVWDVNARDEATGGFACVRETRLAQPSGRYQISADCRRLLADTQSEDGRSLEGTVVDLASGAMMCHFVEKVEWGTACALSPDGRFVAVEAGSTRAREIAIREAATGKLLKHLPVVADVLAFSPDGRILACGRKDWFGGDGVSLWSVGTGKQIGTLAGGAGKLYTLKFKADGRTVCAVADWVKQGCLWTWDVPVPGHKGTVVPKLQQFLGVLEHKVDIAGGTLGTLVWVEGYVAYVCTLGPKVVATSPVLWEDGGIVDAVSISPDGKKVAYAKSKDHSVWIRDLGSGNPEALP
ncbi:MAG: hypothetical protein Q7T82_18070 [Armatimonadota bacterium]|nr:hypothetical protein [Armatimonadota bacterium]